MTAALFAGIALLGATSDPGTLLRPDTVLRPPDGPTFAFVRAPGSPAAAIRVTVPFVESGLDAGAGYLIQLLALERARRLGETLGAEVLAHRTSHALIYQVNGAVADFDHLASVARELLVRPEAPGFVAAKTRLERMNREERETPRGALRLRLRSRMAFPVPSVTGTPESLERLNSARVAELWRASHRRGALSVVVVAHLPLEAAWSALADLGEGGAASEIRPPPEPEAAEFAVPEPERIRVWYGQAHPSGDARDARSPLLMRIARERLDEIDREFEPHLERWELGGRSWVVLTAAASPRDAETMRARVRSYLGVLRATLDPAGVRDAKAALRTELLVRARTPGGLAEVVGRHLDATGGDAAARDYLRRLEKIDFETMVAFVDEIAATEIVAVEAGS